MDLSSVGALLGALLLLTLGAELLVRGSVAVAQRFGVSSFFIGLTIVGFGTSSPELLASLVAALRDQGDLAVGNVVGSNILNIAVILGVTALICPIPVRLAVVRGEVVVVIAVSSLPWVATLLANGVVERWLGALSVAGLVAFLWRGYVVGTRQKEGGEQLEELLAEHDVPPRVRDRVVEIGMIVAGLLLLVFGASLLVESASAIARSLGASELVIGLTIVAAGTSAPELVTSVVSALRGQSDIAVGNVLGSNVFNMLGILGTTSLVRPQTISDQIVWLDAPLMFALSLALLPIVGTGARISRTEGAFLLVAYAAYVVVLFALA
jgi:cation:H+ antiporter